ncbi:MAG: hypothetical protein ACXWUG_29160 [Polyangiales bacterium]
MGEVTVSLHVVTAILGLGQIAGLAMVSTSTLSRPPAAPATWITLERLARGITLSLVVMLLTGFWLGHSVGWAFGRVWWVRLSFLGMLVLGATSGAIRRALRKRESTGEERALRTVARASLFMCAITGAIAVLMEVKPW